MAAIGARLSGMNVTRAPSPISARMMRNIRSEPAVAIPHRALDDRPPAHAGRGGDWRPCRTFVGADALLRLKPVAPLGDELRAVLLLVALVA